MPYELPDKQEFTAIPRPIPIVKTCVSPCKGKKPCIRLCTDCLPQTTKAHWIKEINGNKKYKDGMDCLKLKDHTAKTFYGNSTGTSFLEYVEIPFT